MRSQVFILMAAAALCLSGCGDNEPLTRFENTPPTILNLTADRETLAVGDTAQVFCEAYDPDPDELTYSWSADTGEYVSFLQDRAEIKWQAPETPGVALLRVTVSDQRDSISRSLELLVVTASGEVSGTVRDLDTGDELAGVVVAIGDRSDQTGEDGLFQIDLVPLGRQEITAERSGYVSFSGFVEVGEEPVVYDIEMEALPPATHLSGTVRNSAQDPVSGAICRISDQADTTGADGRYEFFDVPQGEQVLTVARSGYQTFQQTLDLNEAEETFDVVLAVGTTDPPRNVRAARGEGFEILVSWDPADAPETIQGYLVYQTEDGARSPVPGIVPVGTNQRTLTGTEDSRYYFEVASVDLAGTEGSPSQPSNLMVLTALSDLVAIPADPFVMGNYPSTWGNEVHPGNPVYVGSFQIEATEVTNRQYLAFLLETSSLGELEVDSDPQSPDYGVWMDGLPLLRFSASKIDPDPEEGFRIVDGKQGDPVAGVTWHGAAIYAEHGGRRLPTEAEWEKAARGAAMTEGTFPGTSVGLGARYPWGMAQPDGTLANFGGAFGSTRPVGSYPNGATTHWAEKVYDMSGNVWEWCRDWYGPYLNPHSPPGTGVGRILRGGSYLSTNDEVRCGHRWAQPPQVASPRVGFRCAK